MMKLYDFDVFNNKCKSLSLDKVFSYVGIKIINTVKKF